jgi:signal transduction histidine kinase
VTSAVDIQAQLRGTQRLVQAIQDLSLARSVDAIREIVRHAAREMTGADGATFVLRDGSYCHYVDEDAISPLWKGLRFPLETCISGWAMLNRTSAVIEDIYADPRIPADAYRPTFVKSLAMVPIRTADPIGAIGNYWASHRTPTDGEVALLQALADGTSVAMENVRLIETLEQRVEARTRDLERANRELEAFSYAVSHDLRAPIRVADGFARAVLEDHDEVLPEAAKRDLHRIIKASSRMGALVEDLLRLSQVVRGELRRSRVDLADLARDVLRQLRVRDPQRTVDEVITSELSVECDGALALIVLQNLLGNAWKYTSKRQRARIEVGTSERDGGRAFFVRDDGPGFDMAFAERLFTPFQRLHTAAEFEGSGLGLATVQRIIDRHGGRIWAESAQDQGATFWFTLGG